MSEVSARTGLMRQGGFKDSGIGREVRRGCAPEDHNDEGFLHRRLKLKSRERARAPSADAFQSPKIKERNDFKSMGQRTLAEVQIPDAQQDRGPWYVRAGLHATQADLKAAGQRAPGGNAGVKDNAAFPAKSGYQVTPNTR